MISIPYLDEIKSVVLNIISNWLGFAISFFAGFLVAKSKNLVTPRFWKELRRGRATIVIGPHSRFSLYEASGMIGAGDAFALAEIIAYFRKIGFDDFSVVDARSITAREMCTNLVLIGGPDGNSISRDFLEKASGGPDLSFDGEGMTGIAFSLRGEVYAASGQPITRDAAALVFGPSPYSIDAHVLLLAGCYGFGTQAAAQLATRSRVFGGKVRWLKRFDAAITCEVRENGPTSIEIESVKGFRSVG